MTGRHCDHCARVCNCLAEHDEWCPLVEEVNVILREAGASEADIEMIDAMNPGQQLAKFSAKIDQESADARAFVASLDEVGQARFWCRLVEFANDLNEEDDEDEEYELACKAFSKFLMIGWFNVMESIRNEIEGKEE